MKSRKSLILTYFLLKNQISCYILYFLFLLFIYTGILSNIMLQQSSFASIRGSASWLCMCKGVYLQNLLQTDNSAITIFGNSVITGFPVMVLVMPRGFYLLKNFHWFSFCQGYGIMSFKKWWLALTSILLCWRQMYFW